MPSRSPAAPAATNALSWRLFKSMLRIRRFEEAVLKLAQEKAFVGHYHLYIGQEATGVAVMECLEPRDKIATTHRNHGHVLARGADATAAFAEILGRASGLIGGRGGTIHLCDPSLGFLSTSGIVGGCISLGIGAGYACKQRRDGSVAVPFFGDGALEEGVSFEALNIASLWKLPVVFLCENNSGGAWGPAKGGYPTLIHASSDLCTIPQSLGIDTIRVNGADALAVHAAVGGAVAQCRAGRGPVFIEAMAPRWPGSNPLWPEPLTGITDLGMATGDRPLPADHRDWFETYDPVLALARILAAAEPAAAAQLHDLDQAVRAEMAAAVDRALASPMPDPATAFDHVFA